MNADDYKRIISLAIDREVESYTFYRTISDKVKDAGLKRIFNELAGEETKHREFLEGLLSKGTTSFHFDTHKDYKVTDSMPSPKLSADMKPIDGLLLAIKKELEAMQMYNQTREFKYRCRPEKDVYGTRNNGEGTQKPAGRHLYQHGLS